MGRCNEGYACLGPSLQLTAIRAHTCATADDGKVWCWGSNEQGELGDGTTEARGSPVLVRGLPGPAVAASAGYAHTCALLESGQVYCWGDNEGGQTAPTLTSKPVMTPTVVESDVTFTAIAAGQGHTCGISSGGKVYCWGNTAAGQCGVDPKDSSFQVPPTEIPGLDQVTGLETVKNHICAVRASAPTLVCWGSNQYLEDGGYIVHKLGPGAATLNYSASPVPVDLGARVVDVGMGFESTYAVTEDGSVYSWGYNERGQLGIESTDSVVPSPTLVMTSAGNPLRGATLVFRSDGSDQCAETSDSSLGSRYVCWGASDHGELGMGAAMQHVQYATATVLPNSAANLVRGENHGCVTTSRGETTQIECYGLATLVANGTLDMNADQLIPAPIHWDPSAFTPEPE